MSSPRLDDVNIFQIDIGNERSVDVDPKEKELKPVAPDAKETKDVRTG